MIADTFVANAWYVAGFSREFPVNHLMGLTIVGKPIVMWRSAARKVVAFDNRCAHKRMPLSEGKLLEDGTLECAYHGFCYDANGRCVRIPSEPGGHIPARAKLKPYPVIEQDGLVWIWPGDLSRIGNIRPPRTPEISSDKWESITSEPMVVRTNYRLLIENLLDVTHFYPLHNGNVGDMEHSKIPIEVVEEEIDGNRSVRAIRKAFGYKQPPYFVDWFGYEIVDRLHTHCMMNPGITRVEMRAAPPGKLGTEADRGYVLYHTHTPVDTKSHVWRWCMNCRAEHRGAANPSKSLARLIADMFPPVVEQDRWVLEKQQGMFAYANEGYYEVNVRSDKAMLRARRILKALEAAERHGATIRVGRRGR